MTLSPAALAAMPRITPTGVAEQTYASRRTAGAAVGASGLTIPGSRQVWRPTIDGPLLERIAPTALGAHERQLLPLAEREAVTRILVADIERRWPAKDMEVAARYGWAKRQEKIFVILPLDRTMRLPIAPMLLPAVAVDFKVQADRPGLSAIVPSTTADFFARADEFERLRARVRSSLAGTPKRLKMETGRYPTWQEIEAEWPFMANWMNAERCGAR